MNTRHGWSIVAHLFQADRLPRLRATAVVAAVLLAGVAAWPQGIRAQTCGPGEDTLHVCLGLDEVEFCDATCNLGETEFIAASVSDTNFYPKLRTPGAIAAVQAAVGNAGKRKALDNARQVLGKAGFTIVNINSVQDLIAAVLAAYAANGNNPIHLVIVGHGRPGSVKVGEDRLNHDTEAGQAAQTKFVGAVRGLLQNLVLVSCNTAQGTAGQGFVEKLSGDLGAPVHAWTGHLQPDAINKTFWSDGAKKEIPPTATRRATWGGLKTIYR
ncbi:MAG TPA: DUF4347 domain-containing protein [Candidatus Eisenbacteria bacterium]|jgi:hypothetical protein